MLHPTNVEMLDLLDRRVFVFDDRFGENGSVGDGDRRCRRTGLGERRCRQRRVVDRGGRERRAAERECGQVGADLLLLMIMVLLMMALQFARHDLLEQRALLFFHVIRRHISSYIHRWQMRVEIDLSWFNNKIQLKNE